MKPLVAAAAIAVVAAIPLTAYLTELPANSPGRWATGNRAECLFRKNVESMSWLDHARFICLKRSN